MQREKGKRGEREVANLLAKLTGRDIRRRCRQHPGDSDLLGLDPWVIECKLQKALNLNGWWEQALQQQGEDGRPALFWRKHGGRQWYSQLWR